METDEAPSSSIFHTGWRRTRASSLLPKMLTWPTRLRFFRRRTVWLPTWVSWFLIAAISLILSAAWFNYGESLLARNHRVPAAVLVVEGWIGREGVHAAVTEFEHGSYQYIVSTGGLTSGRWEDQPGSYAEMAAREMIHLGVPKQRIIVATADYTESHRTFESAVAVWLVKRRTGIRLGIAKGDNQIGSRDRILPAGQPSRSRHRDRSASNFIEHSPVIMDELYRCV